MSALANGRWSPPANEPPSVLIVESSIPEHQTIDQARRERANSERRTA